jgi:acyl-CoA thioesterase I
MMPRLLLTLCLLFVATVVQADQPIRVACVGDSITFGAGVEKRNENNYPTVLGKLLGDGFVVKNFGNSGSTLLKNGDKPYWKQGEFKAASEFLPNIVVIKLGTNDSKPQNWKHKDQFAADLTALVEHFQALETKPKVYLCRPVPVYQDKWGINEKTVHDEVIPLIEKVASEKKLTVIDLHQALSDVKQHFPDGVHPNAAGAKLLAEAVHAALTKK